MIVKVWHLLAVIGAAAGGVGLLVGGTGGRGIAVAVGVVALVTWILDEPAPRARPGAPGERRE